ncbi:hypothetical protein [Leptospira wolffii]|uniref:hypothetical protein n=1 Tax=Leptospira wolffii TaxID=409998 RepID=UPI0003055F4A|nr:hypothetical protein [Leptospira wolffii]EPG66688.1 putative lipoprotein [Leptospira wolffii serovar Khorat str. Khorat-H2]
MSGRKFSKAERIGIYILIFLISCGGEIGNQRSKSDLQKGLSLFGTVEGMECGVPVKIREAGPDGNVELLYVPFNARVKLKEDIRNYVHYAQEGKYHREYVGWVMRNSTNPQDAERLYQFSLLANLSSSRWYDGKTGEIVPLEGILRYKKSGGEWISLGAFDH